MGLKTGKLPASYDSRDLLFTHFKAMPDGAQYKQAPVGFGVERTKTLEWQMLGNGPDDSVAPGFQGAGDCVEADACHRAMYGKTLAGEPCPPFTGKEAIELYSTLTGYVVGDDNTDQGTDMRKALNYARKTGVKDASGVVHKIGGYCALQAGSWTELLEALAIFDVVSIGVQFPQSAMDQFNAGKPWSYVRSSPIEGGHDVLVVNRPSHLDVEVVTWARLQKVTQSFYTHLCDEAYGIFMPESLTNGKSPEGFDMAAFQQALKDL